MFRKVQTLNATPDLEFTCIDNTTQKVYSLNYQRMKTTQSGKLEPKIRIRPISLQDLLKKPSVDTLKDSHVCFGMLSHMKIDHDICTGREARCAGLVYRMAVHE